MGSFTSKDNIDFFYSSINEYPTFFYDMKMKRMRYNICGNKVVSFMCYDDHENSIMDYDIYVENMNIFEMYAILSKYGKCYIFGDKNNNYKKSRIGLFYDSVWYEFCGELDYKYNVSMYVCRWNLDKSNVISLVDDVDKECIRPIHKDGSINNDFLNNMYNIFNYFKMVSLCVRTMHDEDIDQIRNYCNTLLLDDEQQLDYNYDRIFKELRQILFCHRRDRLYDILNVMYICGVFHAINLNFYDFNKMIKYIYDCEFNEYNNIFYFLSSIKTDDIYKWCKLNKIYCLNAYVKIWNIKLIKTLSHATDEVDMMKKIYVLNNEKYCEYKITKNSFKNIVDYMIRSGLDSYVDYKNVDIEKYVSMPFTINDLEISIFEINKYKRSNIMDLIYEGKLKNNLEDIMNSDIIEFY
jgi:hypothetical protein